MGEAHRVHFGFMAVELVKQVAGLGVPQAHALVGRGASEGLSVRAEGHALNRQIVTLEASTTLTGLEVDV